MSGRRERVRVASVVAALGFAACSPAFGGAIAFGPPTAFVGLSSAAGLGPRAADIGISDRIGVGSVGTSRMEPLGTGSVASAFSFGLRERSEKLAGSFLFADMLPNENRGLLGMGDETAALCERFITSALNHCERTGAVRGRESSSRVGSQVPTLAPPGNRAETARALRWLSAANVKLSSGSKDRGAVQLVDLYATRSSQNSSQDLLVYVPLPQASSASVLALAIVVVGQVRRRRLHRA